MKKIISILLAVMLVVSVAAVSSGAVEYNPSDSYTVSNGTPTCEEAIEACGGDLNDVQHIYFQLPAEDESNDSSIWTNKYNSTDLGLDYCQVCVYWWTGIAGDAKKGWPSGKGCTWVGYKTKLVDAKNRIYEATVPAEGTTMMIWNNGVNGGMDETADIFKYGRQLADANIEGGAPGDYDTLPEGTPNEDNMDNCIAIIDYNKGAKSPLTGFFSYGNNWYVYYGGGCYGKYATTSSHFTSKFDSCCNPEHLANPDKYHVVPGDVNYDDVADIIDVNCIQRHLAELDMPVGMKFNKDNADVDGDGYISIIDATRIQRADVGLCKIDDPAPTHPYETPKPKTPVATEAATTAETTAETIAPTISGV